MTSPVGTTLTGDCGATVAYLRACPDDPTFTAVCGCGAELLPSPEHAMTPPVFGSAADGGVGCCQNDPSEDVEAVHVWERGVGDRCAVTVYAVGTAQVVTVDLPETFTSACARALAAALLAAADVADAYPSHPAGAGSYPLEPIAALSS